MRIFMANLHWVLILASGLALARLHFLKTGEKRRFSLWPDPEPYADSPGLSLGTSVCFMLGMLLKVGEDTFVPYRQGPHRPLSDAEWIWRLSTVATFGAGLLLTLYAIRVENKKQRQKRALIAQHQASSGPTDTVSPDNLRAPFPNGY